MQTQRINITLPYDVARDLRRAIPKRSRSRFIAAVVRDKLATPNLAEQLRKSGEAQRTLIRALQEDFKYADAEAISTVP